MSFKLIDELNDLLDLYNEVKPLLKKIKKLLLKGETKFSLEITFENNEYICSMIEGLNLSMEHYEDYLYFVSGKKVKKYHITIRD